MAQNYEKNGDSYDREEHLMEADDRGVFGPYGLQISAGLRRKYQTVMQPANTRAQILLRSGDEEKITEAESILLQSLPRNERDLEDERYFGIYWGLAEIAMQRKDKIAALDWFQQGITKFPRAVRKNHLRRLVTIGVQLTQWTNEAGELAFDETTVAAVLKRIGETIKRWKDAGMLPLEEMQLHAAGSKLEVQSPLGRWTAARRHRK